jgi:hypothetical protein
VTFTNDADHAHACAEKLGHVRDHDEAFGSFARAWQERRISPLGRIRPGTIVARARELEVAPAGELRVKAARFGRSTEASNRRK